MDSLHILLEKVRRARTAFLDAAESPSAAQGVFKSSAEAWSLSEITEHITLAEQGGINGMWKALDGVRAGKPVFTGELVHQGRSIEEVVAATWGERVKAPDVAAPRWGGPFAFWAASLRACQPVLEELVHALEGEDLGRIVYPHPISGPLDVRQRLEFLRFHLERHTEQVRRVRAHPAFPRE
jgi:hypothetical protein